MLESAPQGSEGRRTGEKLVIDGNIELKVLEVRGNRVRIGIDAPRNREVRRGELPRRDKSPKVLVAK